MACGTELWDRLTSLEQLEIYNRQYWFRLMGALSEDFPGLRVILGTERFRAMAEAHLTDCPSRSFTLRNLGSRLPLWLRSHPEWLQPDNRLARDVTNLEWAHIEAFDAAELPALTPEDLTSEGPALRLILQPYITVLELEYPVDDIPLAVRKGQRFYTTSSGDGRRVPIKHPAPEKVFVAVHRTDFSVYYKRLAEDVYLLLSGIQDGLSLPDVDCWPRVPADWFGIDRGHDRCVCGCRPAGTSGNLLRSREVSTAPTRTLSCSLRCSSLYLVRESSHLIICWAVTSATLRRNREFRRQRLGSRAARFPFPVVSGRSKP